VGTVIIQNETCLYPIRLIGAEAGICWGSDIEDAGKNYKRGMKCIVDNHGRTLEYAQVYMVLDGYSARVIRELYTHIGGMPTRLQASTRYIDYDNFEYVIPPSIKNNQVANNRYQFAMNIISDYISDMIKSGIPKEDAAMLLPLGMCSKVVIRTNLRQLIDMSRQRMCSRAYWEFRQMMNDICSALKNYSEEWGILVDECFHAKCEEYGYCTESKSCGRYQRKE